MENYNRSDSATLLMLKHAKQLLFLMDKTDASRTALQYLEWCDEIEDFLNAKTTEKSSIHQRDTA